MAKEINLTEEVRMPIKHFRTGSIIELSETIGMIANKGCPAIVSAQDSRTPEYIKIRWIPKPNDPLRNFQSNGYYKAYRFKFVMNYKSWTKGIKERRNEKLNSKRIQAQKS